MTTNGVPVYAVGDDQPRRERLPLLSIGTMRGLAGCVVALGAIASLIGLLAFAGGEGFNPWGLLLLAGGAGLVAVGRWVLGEAGREEWGL